MAATSSPLLKCPTEILQEIFSFACDDDRTKSSLSLVSWYINQVVKPLELQVVELKYIYKVQVFLRYLESLEPADRRVKSLTIVLSPHEPRSPKVMELIEILTPHLQSLTIIGMCLWVQRFIPSFIPTHFPDLKNIVIEAIVVDESFFIDSHTAPRLQRIKIRRMDHYLDRVCLSKVNLAKHFQRIAPMLAELDIHEEISPTPGQMQDELKELWSFVYSNQQSIPRLSGGDRNIQDLSDARFIAHNFKVIWKSPRDR
ncbi:hypothetical protein QCA50_007622 [Cerrena zonata]|uniref:F-box domain-containing protein n=1 Tax=Cerrena zonata TaxID=2478898 RepID=A0AAW0G887_9APHY